MSVENYDVASEFYVKSRNAVGIDIILGASTKANIDIKLSSLIDLGCGSGKYCIPLARYFNKVDGVDLSAGQIKEAKKLALVNKVDNAQFFQGDIRSINQFNDNQYNAAIISVVLHHIRSDDGDHFREQRKALSEAIRVVRSDGIIIIATCSHKQVERGAWYCEVMPDHIINLRKSYYTEFSLIDDFMSDNDFIPDGRFVDVGNILHGEKYKDFENIFDPDFRKTDSIFSSLSDTDLDEFLKNVSSLKESGKIYDLISSNNESIANQGQVTFLIYKGS